jgi:hypothetical protein
MATNTLDGITSLLDLIDLNKCLDYITFVIEGKTFKVRVVGNGVRDETSLTLLGQNNLTDDYHQEGLFTLVNQNSPHSL